MKIFRVWYNFYDDSWITLLTHERERSYEDFVTAFEVCFKKASQEVLQKRESPQIIDLQRKAINYMISDFQYQEYYPETILLDGEILTKNEGNTDKSFLCEMNDSQIRKCLGDELVHQLCKLDEEKYKELKNRLKDKENAKKI